MATAVVSRVQPAQSPPLPLHRFTVKQYQRMIETGVLTVNDRVELLEGWVIDKMPRNPPHDGTISRLNRRILRLLPDEWVLRVQSAITLPKSQPEHHFAVVRGPEDTYFQRHPLPRDIALLIEVTDSSLLFDRQSKTRIYARARIPEYWIVNLVASTIQVFTRPKTGKAPAYQGQRDYGKDEVLPLVLAEREIAQIPVNELFP
jgi:Uma2 family endonuclease